MRYIFGLLLFPTLLLSQISDYSVSSIPDEFGKGSNAIVRLENKVIEISSERSMTLRYTRITTVLNEAGNQHVLASVGYDNGTKVKEISAKVYNEEGKLIEKLKRSDFIDVSAVDGGSLYTDSRVLIMSYFPVQYPYTVEFSYTTSSSNTGNIQGCYFQKGFYVDVMDSRFRINYDSDDLKPKIKEKNFEGYNITKNEGDGFIMYRATSIKMLKEEALSPSYFNIMPHIMVAPTRFFYEGYYGSITNWREAGQWMNKNILAGQSGLSQSTIQEVQGLVNGVNDDLEKAKIIFNYVQNNTRYISVQVGIGGIRPISSEEVDNLKYGDCKGLSNYTKSLLDAVGVTSYYVHVEAGDEIVDFERDFASLAQGNHVILALPYNNEYYWLDTTSQVIPFGFIAGFTDDREVLIIKPDGGYLHKTKRYEEFENLQRTTGEVHIDPSGSIVGQVKIDTKGSQYSDHFFLENIDQLDVDEYYKKYWNNINNLELKYYDFKNDKKVIEFNENVRLRAEKYGTILENKLMFTGNILNNKQYIPPRYRNRKFPFQIQRGFLDLDEYSIFFPKGYDLESIPSPVDLENSFGKYSLVYTPINTNEILVKRTLQLNKGLYKKEEYSAFRSFLRNISKADKAKIIVTKT